jgi:hypothetical protein
VGPHLVERLNGCGILHGLSPAIRASALTERRSAGRLRLPGLPGVVKFQLKLHPPSDMDIKLNKKHFILECPAYRFLRILECPDLFVVTL